MDEALAAVGLIAVMPDAPVLEPLYLWPCNVKSWNFFQKLQTQWHMSEAGPSGLDYPGVETVMSIRRIKRRDREDLFDDIQVMELATLAAWEERRQKNG